MFWLIWDREQRRNDWAEKALYHLDGRIEAEKQLREANEKIGQLTKEISERKSDDTANYLARFLSGKEEP